MIEPTSATDRLAEVSRLTSALADQVLDAQATNRPVPRGQVQALAQGAHLLRDHGVDWPPMLQQALHGLAEGIEESALPEEKDQPAEGGAASVIEGLTRLMGAFRRDRGQT